MTIEFGSDEWVKSAGEYLAEHVHSVPAGVRFSMCESFTNPPSHLDDGTGTTAWWFVIDGPSVEVGRGRRADVDRLIEVGHAQALPMARLVYDLADPKVVARIRDAMQAAQAAGAQGGAAGGEGGAAGANVPPELSALLLGLHNHLAPLTR